MNEDIVAAAYLERFAEVKRQFVAGRLEAVARLLYSIDSDDLQEIAAALWQRSNRVATTGGADDAATRAAPPLGSVTSVGQANLRSCDPARTLGQSSVRLIKMVLADVPPGGIVRVAGEWGVVSTTSQTPKWKRMRRLLARAE